MSAALNCQYEKTEHPRGWVYTCRQCGDSLGPCKFDNLKLTKTCKEGPRARPGRELTRLLNELDIHPSEKCGCEAKASQMDKWGPDGCREHRAEIIGWLKEAVQEINWQERIRAAGAMLRTDWFSVLDPFGSLVDEAIRRSFQNSRQA